jgi:Sigma-70 region 2
MYDKYAAVLYGYCHWMLQDSADAAGALQNTLVSATTALGDLSEPSKLRPWLFTLARDECRRRIRPTSAACDEETDAAGSCPTRPARRLMGSVRRRPRPCSSVWSPSRPAAGPTSTVTGGKPNSGPLSHHGRQVPPTVNVPAVCSQTICQEEKSGQASSHANQPSAYPSLG